jgi:hypothetical protein
MLSLDNENSNDKKIGISIYNSIGQLKFEQSIDSQKGINSINIDISALTAGIYFITIKNYNNQITKKLIRN